MVEWWRIMLSLDDECRDKGLLDMLDRVVDLCDKRLDRDERDIAGLFFKGGSIGFAGRLYANRKSWVKAAGAGKDALPVVMQAAEVAPDNADLAFGTGVYDYYADVLPERYPVLSPLMFFLPKGDRARGIRELKLAAAKARYANWEAMYFLVLVLNGMENRPAAARPYARRLAERFPDNVVFQRTLGRIHVRMGDWHHAAETFADIVSRVRAGRRGYTLAVEREAQYYVGYDALLRNDLAAAIAALVRCDELCRALDAVRAPGFMAMAALRLGNVHDVQGQRANALKQYDKVLRLPDYNGSRDLAAKFKDTPYHL